MRDWRGKPIEVGSIVVYPTRHSSYMNVIEARVVEIAPEHLKVERLHEAGFPGWTNGYLDKTPVRRRLERKVVTLTELRWVTVVGP